MATLLKSLAVVVVGTLLGLGITYFTLDRGFSFGALKAGPWVGSPRAGSLNIDPYARALIARTGRIPLGAGEGVSFSARTDSDDRPLDPKCDYLLQGPMPPARAWTVAVFAPSGDLIDNPDKRYGFTSSEVLRGFDTPLEIALAPTARPGNWLPTPATTRFVVNLWLYDSILSATAASLDSSLMPKVVRGACR